MATFEIQPEYAALLQAHGLATFDALFATREGEIVDGHRSRSVARLTLADARCEPVVVYLKRQWGEAAARKWADLLRLRWPHQQAQREWANLKRLASAGIAVAEPVAFGRSSAGGESRALVAVREVPGRSLAVHLAGLEEAGETPPLAVRRALAEAIGGAVRRLHDAGLCYRDLYAKHVFLDEAAGRAPRIALIDPQRLGALSGRRRVDDLAALYATTLSPRVGRSDRVRFLRTYLGAKRLGPEAKNLVGRVERRARRIRGRGQDPNLIAARRVALPGLVPLAHEQFTRVDDGRLLINEAFRAALEASGLMTLDAVMAFEGGESYRRVPGRSTVRAELSDPGGATCAVYVKRYDRVPWKVQVRRTLSLNEPISAARHEVRNLFRLNDAGIATMRLVAWGEALGRGGREERSCLVTEEVAGAVQADDYCEQRFAAARSPAAVSAKRRLARAIGRLARRFHGGGFIHRDFYLCHILVRPREGDDPALHLIDLQRITRHLHGVRTRWLVKDLAALLFSSWPSQATGIRSPVFSDTDRMRLARAYFGVDRLGPAEKRFVRRAIRKARGIARHEQRREARQAAAR